MLELILIRHGETDSNIKGTHLGWTDIPLNEQGIKQAEHIANLLKNEPIDQVYSSPLKRAMQTAHAINKYHGKNIINLDAIKERNFGIWEDLIYDEIKEKHRELHDKWVKDWIDFKIPKGESARETFERVTAAVDEIINKHQEGKVVIVTHLGSIRNIIAYLLGMTIEGSWRFRVLNGSAARIQISDGYAVLTSLNEK
ncbi:MAG: alpha-ribazole phosphatase [Petroclostridium sp.]|jgi:alpha-ribazole phosphatase|uniref:alpha-ribazole phosphatase n=1 Tax=Petroclostridium xylanilyticum TaxID=1792311 RepID=UPI000B98C658|nr:alpha-ribazole phosphatase [Petroclostridium xylanilyticum]MBZ4645488.1 alpha-ribazole phosphatase [Clostridia bacterium]MDK2810555.1 alpha-ribazole phosphatase [Petroclostridium sp.]